MEIIQNFLAPLKRVQICNDMAPWYDKELKKSLSSNKEDLHRMAILNDDIESWREFRRIRNLYNRTVKVKKCNYFHKKNEI